MQIAPKVQFLFLFIYFLIKTIVSNHLFLIKRQILQVNKVFFYFH